MTIRTYLFILALVPVSNIAFGQEINDTISRSIAERVSSHHFPSIAKPWGTCIDFVNNSPEQITHHDIVWESIGSEKSKPGNRVAGANWKGKYPALGETFSNLSEALTRRSEALKLNPAIIILAELRWRDYMDSLLPPDHAFWKRDALGKRIPANGDKMTLPRYFLDTNNVALMDHLCRQAKYMVESGVYDGVFLDWFGPSPGFFKRLRETIGEKYLIITNANYKYDAERAKYINGAYMECYKPDLPDVLPQWEATVQNPKINVVDMMGEQVDCIAVPDLKRMRNTTTYTLVCSNGYLLYGDHFHNHHWFSFWDTSLGEPIGEKQFIEKGVYERAYKNGFVVNNSGTAPTIISFKKKMKRASDDTIARSFKVEVNDGDIFIPVLE